MNSEKKPIIIFGGAGYIGRHVTAKLIERGEPVRVLTRNRLNALEILGNKVEIIEGDVTDKESVKKSLKGARAILICLSAFQWKTIKRIKEIERDAILLILEEAKRVGISRLVYCSGYEMREDVLRKMNALKFGEIKIEIESVISQSDFNWTILGFAPSVEIMFAFLKKNKMTVPGGGEAAIPTISVDDVAEITSQTITRSDLNGKRFRLTGPEALSFPEAAKRISGITGKPVKVKKIPLQVIKIAAFITRPINPFVQYIYWSLKLLNNFPKDLAEKVPEDNKLLQEIFDYKSTSFEEEVRKRFKL